MYLYALITFHSKPGLPKADHQVSHHYAFHFLIASREKEHRIGSQTDFWLMSSPATTFLGAFLRWRLPKGHGLERENSADFGGRGV